MYKNIQGVHVHKLSWTGNVEVREFINTYFFLNNIFMPNFRKKRFTNYRKNEPFWNLILVLYHLHMLKTARFLEGFFTKIAINKEKLLWNGNRFYDSNKLNYNIFNKLVSRVTSSHSYDDYLFVHYLQSIFLLSVTRNTL